MFLLCPCRPPQHHSHTSSGLRASVSVLALHTSSSTVSFNGEERQRPANPTHAIRHVSAALPHSLLSPLRSMMLVLGRPQLLIFPRTAHAPPLPLAPDPFPLYWTIPVTMGRRSSLFQRKTRRKANACRNSCFVFCLDSLQRCSAKALDSVTFVSLLFRPVLCSAQ